MEHIGDVVFVHGKGILSRLIEFFDKGRFSHCYFVFPHDSCFETQYFVNTRIIRNVYKHKSTTSIHLNLTDEQIHKLIQTSFNYLEDKYDFKQIIGLLFHYIFGLRTNKTWNNPKLIICSELIIDALYDISYLNESEYKQLRNATPNILYAFLKQKTENKQTA